jgi:hypothetical protein
VVVSELFEQRIWAGVERRLATVEAFLPEAPPWRPSEDAHASVARRIRLGPTLAAPTSLPGRMRSRLALVLIVIGLLVAAIVGALMSGFGRPPSVDPSSDPFGPLGIQRGSDSGANAAVLRDGRVLIVSGGWQGTGNAVGRVHLWDPGLGLRSASPSLSARVNPTATLLLDGRVLVIGGYGGPFQYASTALPSAELFDPATGAWSSAGSLSVGRVGHTATLLADGRVLVIGGMGSDGTSASADLWDPVTMTSSPAGTLGIARSGHASVLLPDGQVLVAGGRGANGAGVGVTELWDPATGEFTQSVRYLDSPPDVTATRLLGGRVLLAGVWIGAGGFSGVSVTQWPGPGDSISMSRPREGHAATLLVNGDVLVTGGGPAGTGEATASVELWVGATGRFRAAPPMDLPAARHAAVLLPDGRVLIVPDGSGPEGFADPFVYDPAAVR